VHVCGLVVPDGLADVLHSNWHVGDGHQLVVGESTSLPLAGGRLTRRVGSLLRCPIEDDRVVLLGFNILR
jgi:hypothetical protein